MVQTRNQVKVRNGLISTFPLFCEFFEPQDLLRFVISSKDFFSLATYQVVVWISTVNGNQRTNRTVRYLLEQTRVGSIHLPSPLRVLRLVCVKRCEACNRRTLYNLPRYFGLAFCWDCLSELTDYVHPPQHRRHQRNIEWHDIVIHPRVVAKKIQQPRVSYPRNERFNCNDRYCMLKHPFRASGGAPQGPLVTISDGKLFVDKFRTFNQIDRFITHNVHGAPLDAYDELNNFIAQSRNIVSALEFKRHERMIRGKVSYRIQKYEAVKRLLVKLGSLVNERMRQILQYRRVNHRFLYLGAKVRLRWDRPDRCLIFANNFVERKLFSALRSPVLTMRSTSRMNELAQTLNSYPSDSPAVHYPEYQFHLCTTVRKEEWEFFHHIVNDTDNIDYGFFDSPRNESETLRTRHWAYRDFQDE